MSRLRGALTVLMAVAGLGAAAGVPAAHAAFGVSKFDAGTCAKDTEPSPQCTTSSTSDFFYQQTAGHPPFGITDFAFNTTGLLSTPDGSVKDVRVDLPPGLSVNPQALPQCTTAQLQASACPATTQVGTNYITAISGGLPIPVSATVYNMVPPQGVPALFGFTVPLVGGQIYLVGGVAWDSDYHESFTISDIPTTIPLVESRLVFSGVAGDGTFLTLPSACEGPQTTRLQVDSYQSPGQYLAYRSTTPVGTTGCAGLPFSPSVSVAPDTHAAGEPAGVAIDVKLPQNPNGTDQPNTATLKDATVTLPQGMSINPSAATGLQGCTNDQLGMGTANPVTCPGASAIGTVDIETPVLPAGSLTGQVYLGQPLSGDPLSGDEYRIFLDAESPRYGVSVRLIGHITADPATGQLTARFADNPQIPVSLVHVALRGGPQATLVNPPACGSYTATAAFTSWGGQTASASSAFAVDAGCPDPNGFQPSLAAGASTTQAGASPTFGVTVARNDADQLLSRIDVTLPPGLLAKTAGIPLCPDAQAAAGTCGEDSRIGSTSVAAGAGPSPFGLGGRVYLTGPYNGGPYGLSIVVPAIAGPFDLGTVVVRAALLIDPNTAQARVVSDPLPTILDGIPLLLRSAAVTIDRPDTMRNPTSCSPLQLVGSVTSTAGRIAAVAAPFAPAGCAALPFSPSISLALTNKTQTTDGRHPGVDSTVTQKAGQANIRQVKVTLPLSLALDPANAETLCSWADGLKATCPATSVVGTATADTPLLPRPLTGKVYFVKGIRFNKENQPIATLPTLLVVLRGDIVLNLRAATEVSPGGRLITTFANIPDAAISRFRLTLSGGHHGILVVTHHRDVCSGRQEASIASTGQNAKARTTTATIATPCPKAPTLGRAKAAKGHRLTITVKAPGTGKLVVGGAHGRLVTVTRKVKKAGTVRFTLKLTTKAAKLLARRHRLSERVSARYAATGGAGRTVTSNLVTLKR